MIDGVKIVIRQPGYAGELFQNQTFSFISEVSEATGELVNAKKADYQGLKIRIYNSGTVIISGSLHKFHNSGQHNHDDFFLKDVYSIVNAWQALFQFDPCTAKIVNIEFGVNIKPPRPCREILKNLILHKRQPFEKVSFYNSNFRESSHQQYYVKCYDKAKQYHQDKEILRFEIKFVKMAELNDLGIKHFSDLLNKDVYPKLGSILCHSWDEVLLIEPHKRQKLTDKQKSKYAEYQNPNYWITLAENPKSYLFNKEVRKFKKLLPENNLHSQIGQLIRSQWQKLSEKTEVEKTELAKINHLCKELVLAIPPRTCIVTGIAIDMQRSNSRFLSIAGLKYLRKTDPEKFREIEKRYSSRKYKGTLKHLLEIAHHIRDAYTNPVHNNKRDIKNLYDRNPALFDQKELIQPDRLLISNL
jgi:hypothetical protein